MNQQIQTTAIVRDRGQLTLPDIIRRIRTWTSPSSVVTISTTRIDEIVITPYSTATYDWNNIWAAIKRARSYKGRGGGNLSAFIAKDRQTRR